MCGAADLVSSNLSIVVPHIAEAVMLRLRWDAMEANDPKLTELKCTGFSHLVVNAGLSSRKFTEFL